jgi:hypothetical protein
MDKTAELKFKIRDNKLTMDYTLNGGISHFELIGALQMFLHSYINTGAIEKTTLINKKED